mmetsp:Transcript_26336/g.61884  ORF Transcript_26336/g.61884 Transcript_26336/m.61884 type:complete len:91 (+) Transcript_26336:3189-3461(+)
MSFSFFQISGRLFSSLKFELRHDAKKSMTMTNSTTVLETKSRARRSRRSKNGTQQGERGDAAFFACAPMRSLSLHRQYFAVSNHQEATDQ